STNDARAAVVFLLHWRVYIAESSWTHLNDGIQCNFEPINATPNSTEIPRVATQIREEPKIHVPMSKSCHRLYGNPQAEKNFFSTQFSDV
ncbi:MAG: hypothetical protein DWI22_16725, partial [Planctomycetota bacterium]